MCVCRYEYIDNQPILQTFMLIFSILSAQVADTLSEASSGGDFLASPLFALLALVGVAVGAFIVVYLVSRVLPKLITLIGDIDPHSKLWR